MANETKQLPKVSLGFFPTPLHRLNNLSDKLGVNLYLKRDDLTGPNLFGGNKIRKLEFILGDAMEKGCDTIITFGATQSNHAMQTAVVARKLGLDVILYLNVLNEVDEEDDRANILVDKILGAEINYISLENRTEAEADEIAVELALAKKVELEKAGHNVYLVPVGGATEYGSAGFISGFEELKGQFHGNIDYVVNSTGTGSTTAGLVAGAKLYSDKDHPTQVLSINVSPKPLEHYQKMVSLANKSLELINVDTRVTLDDFHFDQSYFGEGYEIPTEEASSAIRELARTEGILLDPVYTGKGFSGLLDYIRSGQIPQGSNVVFWHTGGVSALFAEKEMVGKLY